MSESGRVSPPEGRGGQLCNSCSRYTVDPSGACGRCQQQIDQWSPSGQCPHECGYAYPIPACVRLHLIQHHDYGYDEAQKAYPDVTAPASTSSGDDK